MKRILVVFGTRPEAIKLAPVIHTLKRHIDHFHVGVCLTAQHREMLDQTLAVFGIQADFDLNLMTQGQSLEELTARAMCGIGQVLKRFYPDLVLVQGDTTTTFAAALACYYGRIDVGHVEAGLRTDNRYAPFPEEIFRRMTSCIARYHFAPTKANRANLIRENISSKNILVTGNTGIDALLMVKKGIGRDPGRKKILRAGLQAAGFHTGRRRIVLVTGHRRENYDQGLDNICKALLDLAHRNTDVDFVYPVHPNPLVQEPVYRLLGGADNIFLLKALSYDIFVYLMSKSHLIITDSGGIQEEAPSLGKPVLVTREVTERTEALQSGAIRLVGTKPQSIINEVDRLLNDADQYERMRKVKNPYGDGRASIRIIQFLLRQK